METKTNLRERVVLESVDSTQDYAARLLRQPSTASIILAHDQTSGHGRFERPWFSEPGSSLTTSLIFREHADHPMPWIIGMRVALAVAGVCHARVAWPNDVMHNGRKLAGVLTQVLPDYMGRKVPVVGVGVNLRVSEFPEDIRHRAVSLHDVQAEVPTAEALLDQILARLDELPEPTNWQAIQPIWMHFDSTPGKKYQLPTGEEAVAMGFGPNGELLCSVQGEARTVMAAEAIFGLQFD